jgi:hypothetical protein
MNIIYIVRDLDTDRSYGFETMDEAFQKLDTLGTGRIVRKKDKKRIAEKTEDKRILKFE